MSGLLYSDGADAKLFGDSYVRELKCNYTTAADSLTHSLTYSLIESDTF